MNTTNKIIPATQTNTVDADMKLRWQNAQMQTSKAAAEKRIASPKATSEAIFHPKNKRK